MLLMKKQLFYKDIFDKLGNRIPVKSEVGQLVFVDDEPATTTQKNGQILPAIDNDFFYPLVNTIVDFVVQSCSMLCFATYNIVNIKTDLSAKSVNVSYNNHNFIQTWVADEGIIWIQTPKGETVEKVVVEFNGVVKNITQIQPC